MEDFLTGKWIWIDNNRSEINQYVYFRKDIAAKGQIDGIRIKVSASNKYKMYINGEFYGLGPSPCTPEYQYYDEYCLKEFNEAGNLCISFVVYNIGEKTEMVTEQNKGIPAFIAEIIIIYKNGNLTLIGTDEAWKSIKSPSYYSDSSGLSTTGMRISQWGGYKEVFVAGKEPINWKLPGFDDSSWNNVVFVEESEACFINLIPREIPFLKMETVYPRAVVQIEKYMGDIVGEHNLLNVHEGCTQINASKPGSFPAVVIDFGKEVVGYVEVNLKGSKDGNMSIWYGESLDMQRVDTLIMEDGDQTYIPYHRKAFRYLKLVFNSCEAIVELKNIKLHLTHYPYTEVGKFECSNKLLNDIWKTSVYTCKLGTQDHFEDSVWREGVQWLVDGRVMSLVNYWVFGDKAIVRKAIRQFFMNQNEDGSIPAAGPQKTNFLLPDFCAYFITMNYEYYYYTGDVSFLREVFPKIQKLMDWFEAQEGEDGLFADANRHGWWCFIDWADLDKRDKVTAINCLYYKALTEFIELKKLADDVAEERYEIKAERLKETINLKMYDNEKGLYADCLAGEERSAKFSQQTNLLAIHCNIVPEDRINDIYKRVYSEMDIEAVKGVFLMSFITDTLFNIGEKEKALELIEDFWGEMLKRGATTWWETFDRSTKHSFIPYQFTKNNPTYLQEYVPVSHCHGWGSGPAFVLMKNVLGIKPVKEGFKEIIFEPYTEKLSYCKGIVPTPYGEIKVDWEKDENGIISYTIDKPEDIKLINNQQ